MNILNICK